MQVQDNMAVFGDLGFDLLAVGFSPAEGLRPIVDHLSWTSQFCSDEQRSLYGRLGIGRAGPLKVFNAGTRAMYRDAQDRGEKIERPVEDIRQLGGDVLVVDGVARRLARPSSPDDRPSVADLLGAAHTL